MLHRKLISWEWYTCANTMRLFVHCLLSANHKDAKWRGKEIERAQFITSIDKLAQELGLTRQKIRTALKNLQLTNDLTIQSTTQHTVITVNNYDSYQSKTEEQQTNQQTNNKPFNNQTNKQITSEITTNNKDNNEKNLIINNMSSPPKKGDFSSNTDMIKQTPTVTSNFKKRPHKKDAENLIRYLNEKTGRCFELVDSNLKKIESVLSVEGRDFEIAKRVIDHKCEQWLNDDKMNAYLRPATLFRKENFAQYVGQLGSKPKGQNAIDEFCFGKNIQGNNFNKFSSTTIEGTFSYGK